MRRLSKSDEAIFSSALIDTSEPAEEPAMTIPDDIMKAAEAVCVEHGLISNRAVLLAIARALMAERERCAKIADCTPDEDYDPYDLADNANYWTAVTRQSIAAAIRGGTNDR
jgi:hypothetical protein